MRTYVVQQGDSPASIAARPDMASCPKCAIDLVLANPQKEAVRYPNGFVTFKTLRVGEVLNIPAKWGDGTLDTLPQSYFDGLPQMPTRAPISEGTKSSIAGVGQALVPGTAVQSCTSWAFGGEVHVGQTMFQAINPNVSMAAFAQAASFMPESPYAMEIGGKAYYFKPVAPSGVFTHAAVPQVQIYYCARHAAQARPRYMGVGAGGSKFQQPVGGAGSCVYPGQVHDSVTGACVDACWNGSAPAKGQCPPQVGAPGAPPPVGQPGTPPWPPDSNSKWQKPGATAGGPSYLAPPCCQQFTLGEEYSLTVWPIPQGGLINPDPSSILADLNFEVTFAAANPDGSWTTNVIYKGTTPYSPNFQDALTKIVFYGGSQFGSNYVIGETIQGGYSGTTATVTNEFDTSPLSAGYGVLTLSGASGMFMMGEALNGLTSKAVARNLYQYSQVMVSPKSGGMLGLTSVLDQGTSFQMPYVIQPGDQASMTVRPTTDQNSDMSDPVSILVALGFAGSDITLGAQNPDCTWPVQVKSSAATPITIDEQPADPSTGALMWVTALTVNGNVILAPTPPPPPIAPPTMSACHAFTLTFIQNQCAAINGGPFDPTDGLSAMGLTKFTLSPVSGPDAQGQWSVNGVWELGDGFVLPASKKITITQFQDNGPSVNVAGGPCGSGLPFTIQPGDSINAIVRPMAVPGQPMTNPVALLTMLGFQNVSSASPYSDCTWLVTADWPGPQPLQITDPMISPSAGGMWIVGFSVNGTTVKDANWLALQEQPIDSRAVRILLGPLHVRHVPGPRGGARIVGPDRCHHGAPARLQARPGPERVR